MRFVFSLLLFFVCNPLTAQKHSPRVVQLNAMIKNPNVSAANIEQSPQWKSTATLCLHYNEATSLRKTLYTESAKENLRLILPLALGISVLIASCYYNDGPLGHNFSLDEALYFSALIICGLGGINAFNRINSLNRLDSIKKLLNSIPNPDDLPV